MFIDEVEIYVSSGKGGSGCVSFRREKFIPKGGPDGGDGGRGGDVILQVDPQMNTLQAFTGRHHWIAENGRPGEGSRRTGRSGRDLILHVPPGTLVFDRDSQLRLTELVQERQRVILLPGGRGGLGNSNFATSRHQAPRHATPGHPARERWVRLELKLIADVGLVGMPNAGKSTLLSRTTHAKPKIADYPFTTLEPQLGIVRLSDFRTYVLADIPGLIRGAHAGSGLGDAFLRHIERTRLLIHLVDLHPPEGQPDPAEAYAIIREELRAHDPKLAAKTEIVVATKMDLGSSPERMAALRQACGSAPLPISGVSGQGLPKLHEAVWRLLSDIRGSQDEPACPTPSGTPTPVKPPEPQIEREHNA